MNPFWDFAFPSILLLLAGLAVRWAKKLQFFSRAARGLDQIDIPNEISEIRMKEFETLVNHEADSYLNQVRRLTHRQRRQAVTQRLRETRKWLHLIISNVALFQEVARFRIEQAASTGPDFTPDEHDVAFQIMDRAAVVHLMAATCLAKLRLIDLYRLFWPFYVPRLANRFQVRRHDLIAWYRHLAKEMLDLAQKHYDHLTYTRLISQLAGSFSVEG